MSHEFTVHELETIVRRALNAGDMKAVVAALQVMSTKDADRAGELLAVIELGIALRG